MKRIMAMLLAFITIFSMLPVPSFAASTSHLAKTLNDYLPIATYITPLSHAKKVYAYSNSSLTKKSTSYYIDTYSDQVVITDVSKNGQAIYVTYPTTRGQYRSKWFKTSDILGVETVDIREYTAKQKLTVYRLSSASTVKKSGSISKKDDVVSLGKYTVKNKNYYVTIYPLEKKTEINGIRVKYKIALNTIAGYNDPYYENTQIEDTQTNKKEWISEKTIKSAAKAYNIDTNSEAYEALLSINTKYASKFSTSEKKGTLIFLFEGVGNTSSSSKRMNAMCVVVQNGKITYINRNSSTIPDYPFDPSRNDNTDMPTLKSGIYSFTTVNHQGSYAALKISNAKVLRFSSKSDFYSCTSTGINVHRRSSNSIASASVSWVNSAGCLLIGKSGTSYTSEYAEFIQTLGIVGSKSAGNAKYSSKVTGKIIVDRSFGYDYMRRVGYSTSAIKALG